MTEADRPLRELCPVCGVECVEQKCKLICPKCRIIVRSCAE